MNALDKKQKLLVIVESPNKVHTVAEIFKELGYEKTTVMASVGHTTQIKDKYGEDVYLNCLNRGIIHETYGEDGGTYWDFTIYGKNLMKEFNS